MGEVAWEGRGSSKSRASTCKPSAARLWAPQMHKVPCLQGLTGSRTEACGDLGPRGLKEGLGVLGSLQGWEAEWFPGQDSRAELWGIQGGAGGRGTCRQGVPGGWAEDSFKGEDRVGSEAGGTSGEAERPWGDGGPGGREAARTWGTGAL